MHAEGIDTYLIDNDSTDDTVEIAEQRLGHGLVGIERFERDGIFRWERLLHRKEQLAAQLDADWFMHIDPDEFPVSARPGQRLIEAFAEADTDGYDVFEFDQFVFIPTAEDPNHDHPRFRTTMRWYYPFAPAPRHWLRAWKRQPQPVDLTSSGGHRVQFPGAAPAPEAGQMRHYLFLSFDHCVRKYVGKVFDPDELRRGWHGWRPTLTAPDVWLPSAGDLRIANPGEDLDGSDPRASHCLVWDRP